MQLLTAVLGSVMASILAAASPPPALVVASPNGRLVATIDVDAAGAPGYSVALGGRPVLRRSRLGLVREEADFSRGLKLLSVDRPAAVQDRYEILTAKRRTNVYRANRGVLHLQASGGGRLDVVFQVSDDGVAFRYVFPDSSERAYEIREEVSSFHFLPEARAWLQPMAVAKSGWSQSNPSYEEYYLKDVPAGTAKSFGAGWALPALFRSGDVWLLVSETAVGRNYCGSRLRSEAPDGEYSIGFPDPRESYRGGPVNPRSRLPWTTPWRLVVVANLATIAESMLGVDLADPARQPVDSSVVPGKASWSWPLLGDPSANYATQKQFIDYAAEMGWRYCLIDALWDYQIGYPAVKELVDYARSKGVRILLWYNSAGDWNTTPQTPRDRMVTHERRILEFDRLKAMGVTGLKIDFFGGDGQSVIGYYHDILEDAQPYGFLINFHGATLPRGWERTYPHLMTMEAIRGLEYVTFEQANADQEATHAAMLPFTRNVFDPMDFTPMALDRINDRIQRRTVGRCHDNTGKARLAVRRRQQAQVAFRHGGLRVPGQVAVPGHVAFIHGVAAELGVIIAAHPVGQHGGDRGAAIPLFPVVLETKGHGAEGAGHGRGIQHQQHRQAEQLGQGGGGRFAVVEAHHPFHQDQVVLRCRLGQAPAGISLAAEAKVDVVAGLAAGHLVNLGVEKVGAALEDLDPPPLAGVEPGQGGDHGGLALAGGGGGDEEGGCGRNPASHQ